MRRHIAEDPTRPRRNAHSAAMVDFPTEPDVRAFGEAVKPSTAGRRWSMYVAGGTAIGKTCTSGTRFQEP
jgi:hypothetical protein